MCFVSTVHWYFDVVFNLGSIDSIENILILENTRPKVYIKYRLISSSKLVTFWGVKRKEEFQDER